MEALVLAWFAKGFGIGIAIAAPVGPVGVLCVQRTLSSGRLLGFASGLGAAVADAIYGSVAAFGLSLISHFLLSHQFTLRLIGGCFLLFLGARTLLSHPARKAAMAGNSAGLLRAFGSTFILTLTNPITIMAFVGLFAGLGLAHADGRWSPGLSLVGGVFAGSAFWWLVLALGAGRFRAQLANGGMLLINRLSGSIILGFGIYALGSLLW